MQMQIQMLAAPWNEDEQRAVYTSLTKAQKIAQLSNKCTMYLSHALL
jgi:hypothetical protein